MLLNALFLPLYWLGEPTSMTGLRGCVVFPLLCVGISLSASSFPIVMTGCFFIFLLKYMYFTLFSTFNLILSATGMTGWDGRKTYEFHRLARLVADFLLLCPGVM